MNYSIDSNILIALINPKDRLHKRAISIMKNGRNDYIILCSTVLSESQNLFRNRINQIIVEIIQFLPNFQNKKMSQMEYQEQLIISFKKIKSSNPGISNFLDLVYNEILKFLKDNDSHMLPAFLSQLAINYSQSLYKKLDDMHSNDGKIILLNHNHLKAVKEATIGTYFKDPNDERIFFELMTNLLDIVPINFYTGDSEFVKKINKSYPSCLVYFKLNDNSFSCCLVKD
ncbi:hypothetical protein MettiDRAFT_0793 [Methanolobus tindarius DSM 2278]|jgi:hypothetical protein|uniref:PIN domain-containing protein n=1 Tax=Methanolobus tindarius DSM 2278 TaxID=1090322 RepID=W9DUL2_METTI|nr:hypothetical protein [Methanolobus tindarius]ETA67372.1 hypothetical protein MettiDRAFT_0793 [Methanolobus tindarius DSM 2278]